MCALMMMLMSINPVNVSAATMYKKTMYVKSTYLHPMRGCKWSSSNKVCRFSVNCKGMIKALKPGTATNSSQKRKNGKISSKSNCKKETCFQHI